MASPKTDETARYGTLPWRDYFLLPLIAVLTVVVILGCGEIAGRVLWASDDEREPCEYRTSEGFRYTPFCTSRTKVWEGPWITQAFNDCGYRSAVSCAVRPTGTRRVVVMGSSTARGALVNYQDSFAAISSSDLSERCGDLVDFQNLGTEPSDMNMVHRRVAEALSLRASAIVLTASSFDVMHLNDPPPAAEQHSLDWSVGSIIQRLRTSRVFLMMQYYLYRDPAFQLRGFLLNGDAADFLRRPLSPAWQDRVAAFGDELRLITAQTQAAGVPVFLVYVPTRAQAALAASDKHAPEVDASVLPAALSDQAVKAGAVFIDATRSFASAKDFQSLFYLTDGHPAAGGHAAIARALVPGLLAQAPFSACSSNVSAIKVSRQK